MLVSDYNYNLPEENIAKHPPKVRGTTRLLVLDRNTGNITDSRYADLADFLESGDLIILNDTRVMRARVFAELPGGYKRELVVLEKHKDDLNSVMYHGKLRAGDVLTVLTTRDGEKTIDTVTIREILGNGTATVSSSRPLADIVEQYGTVPLPPYLRRDADPDDIKRYQTVWAKELGSAAAPTASLNMTEELIDKLKTKGVNIEYLTLMSVSALSCLFVATRLRSIICTPNGSISQSKPSKLSKKPKKLITK